MEILTQVPSFLLEPQVSPPTSEKKLPWERLENLQDELIVYLDQFAGLGHLRIRNENIAGAQEMGCPDNMMSEVVVHDLIAGRAHGPGSNNKFAKSATEFMQRHPKFQEPYQSIYRRIILRSDQEKVRRALRKEIISKNKKRITVILSHPDLATVMDASKAKLERELGVEIFLVLIIPDHLPERAQTPYYILGADLIITPDTGSARVAMRETDRWWLKTHFLVPWAKMNLPIVEVVPHSVHPFLREELTESEFNARKAQVTPDAGIPLRSIISMGGSAPLKEYVLKLTALSKNCEHHVLVKDNNGTAYFIQQLGSQGIDVEKYPDNETILTAYPELNSKLNPAVTIVKPGELINHVQFDVKQRGGTILLIAPPIGDQEYQNIEWARDNYLIPRAHEQRQLEHLILRSGSRDKIAEMVSKAKHWRGLALPKDSTNASKFISETRRLGILAAMMDYRDLRAKPFSETDDSGVSMLYEVINFHLGRRNQGLSVAH